MKTVIVIVCFVFVVATSTYLHDTFYKQPRIKDIKENTRITFGVVTFVRYAADRGPTQCSIEYDYTVNGKTRSVQTPLHNYQENKLTRNDLLYQHFPVVYSTLHNDVSDILLTSEDSSKYGIK
jgi:hypothetical protein